MVLHVLVLPVWARGGSQRAHVYVHALQVHEEFLPRERSGRRRADDEAPADARSKRSARDHQEARRSGARPGAADVDAVRFRLLPLSAAPEEHVRACATAYRWLWVAGDYEAVARQVGGEREKDTL